MPKLKALEFDYNAMGDPGAAALAASAANLPRLEELDMSYNQITPAGMKRLAASKVFANVTRLRIANPLGGEGVRYLARCRHLKKLTMLELHGGEVGDELVGPRSTRELWGGQISPGVPLQGHPG